MMRWRVGSERFRRKTRQKFEVVKRYYEKNELLPEMKAKITSDKTLDFLLQKSDITYV